MRFARFGVSLEKLQAEHLEMVRRWRNSDWVLPRMRFRAPIAPDDQTRWFDALDRRNNWYFVAHLQGVPFGLFHIKDIDWARGCGESGGFVSDPSLIGRPEPGLATLALMDFAFLLLQLQSLEAQYHSGLPKIANFNRQLGYQVLREGADGFVRACVTAEQYFARAALFRHAAAALYGDTAILTAADPWLTRRIEADYARFEHFGIELP
jgi:RimJ/RimL family protein N-acetyltransferase